MEKKLTDDTLKTTSYFFTAESLPFSSVRNFFHVGGFVYQHPIYNTLSAQAP
ncbi:MAG: hypothetical protein HRU69_11155 [Flammeovirgaceae bacterium]|nr:MAG: hypothetical protein HRU69_11155 [Flammeovirgaceae bacterium]